ncbi:unnamed protein product [Prorocentrum cordatum]|nr:unnamed protein product [Polarella glacialis]
MLVMAFEQVGDGARADKTTLLEALQKSSELNGALGLHGVTRNPLSDVGDSVDTITWDEFVTWSSRRVMSSSRAGAGSPNSSEYAKPTDFSAAGAPSGAASPARIAEEFSRLDFNRDGVITRAEFGAAGGVSVGSIDPLAAVADFNQIDTNADGVLSRSEFIEAAGAISGASDTRASKEFGALDTNGDGVTDLPSRIRRWQEGSQRGRRAAGPEQPADPGRGGAAQARLRRRARPRPHPAPLLFVLRQWRGVLAQARYNMS